MSKAAVKHRILKITVLTGALLGVYTVSYAAGPVAYTPYGMNMDPSTWTKDRGGDPGLTPATWQGRDALRLSISPPQTPDSFNNWQGHSQRTQAPAGESFLRGDLWIEDSWTTGTENDFQNTGMWGSAMPADTVAEGDYVDSKAVFPIIHFTNQKDAAGNPDGTGVLRIWDTTLNPTGGWVYLEDTAGLINYGSWNSIDLRLVPEENKVEYYFNGTLVHTWRDPTADDDSKPGQFFAMYLKARNNGTTEFDTYWSRLMSGEVYRNGVVSGAISGDVLVDAGAGVSVADGTAIGGSLYGNGGATAASVVNFDKNVAIGGELIGSNTTFNFSTAADASSSIAGNVTLEDRSAATGGNSASRIQAGGNISLDNSTLKGYWHLPSGSVIALGGARIEDANIRADLKPAVIASGAGSSAAITQSALLSAGTGSGSGSPIATVRATNGSTVVMEGGSISATGSQYARGILAMTGANVTTTGTEISTTGANSHAVSAQVDRNNTDAVPVITLNDGTVSTAGNESWGLFALRGGQITANNVDIRTEGNAGFGAFIENNNDAGVRPGLITLNGGSITTTGGYIGDKIGSHGVVSKHTGNHVEINGTRISTSGVHANGLRAEDGATIRADNAQITTSGDVAYGVYAREQAQVQLSNTTINTSGHDAGGLVAEATGSSSFGGRLIVNNTHVATGGEIAHAAMLYGGGSSLDMTGGSLRATGAGAAGLFLSNNSSAVLTGVNVVSAGPSIISRFKTEADREQSITIGAGSNLTQNNGVLLQVLRQNESQAGKVTLTLQSGSYASGNIENYDKDGKLGSSANTTFNVSPGAQWAGINVDDKTKFIPADEPTQTDYTTGPGESVVIEGGGTPTVFNGTTTIGGSSSVGPGSQASFNGPTSIGGSVVGQAGSSLTFGGGQTTIGESVTGGAQSTFAFNGPTTISQNLEGAGGAAFTFAGGATISQNVAGLDGANFNFSQTAPTTIGGNVTLNQGSMIHGGTASAPITIAGNTSVSSGSVLGGNLVIGGALSANGAQLAPGNSIGKVVVNSVSDLTDSSYVAEVNGAGQSDLIVVRTGDVNLSGVTLQVAQENGNGGYVLNHDYTILQTEAGNVVNTFKSANLDSSLSNTLAKLDPVKYGAKDVKVRLSVDADKVAAKRTGLSSNQNATLDGVISVAGMNASADAALQSTDTKDVLNQLSGELHGSTQSALLNSSGLVMRTVSNRMRGNVGAGMKAGAPTAQSSGSVAGSMPTSAAYPLWAEVVGNWNSLKGDDNTAKVKTSLGGLFVGGDAAVGSGWRVGGALGFTDGKVEVNDRSSKSDVRSYTAAIYGGNSWAASKGQVNFLAGAAYTRHDIDSRRHVTVGGNQTLKADYKANGTQLFTELGYAFPLGQASSVEPYLGVAWLSQRAKGFDESGGSAALRGDSRTDSVTTMTLGLRGKTMVDTGRSQAALTAGLGWRHAAGDVDPSRQMAFIQGNGATFKVAGAPIAKNAAVLDLGAEMTVGKNAAMGLAYGGQFGNGQTDNTGSLYLRVRFK